MNLLSIHSLAATALLASAFAAGCGGDKVATDGASSAKPAGSSAAAAPKPAEAAKPVELADHDLSSADPKWAGWTVKAPAGAKVLADGAAGARVAGKGASILDRSPGGDRGIDVAFAWGKQDLKELKANLEKGAAAQTGEYKSSYTWVKEDADTLEWTNEVGKTKSFNFVKHIKAEGQDITCKNNYMMGSGNEAEHKRAMEVCGTLAKKK